MAALPPGPDAVSPVVPDVRRDDPLVNEVVHTHLEFRCATLVILRWQAALHRGRENDLSAHQDCTCVGTRRVR